MSVDCRPSIVMGQVSSIDENTTLEIREGALTAAITPPSASRSGQLTLPLKFGEAASLLAEAAFWPGEAFDTPGFCWRM